MSFSLFLKFELYLLLGYYLINTLNVLYNNILNE